jgi:hypothetical protein
MISSTSHVRARIVSGIATLLGVAIAGVAGAQSSAGYHVAERLPLIPGSFTLLVLEP